MRFFFYGTLMDSEVRALVLGRGPGALPVEPATLSGYRRVVVRRESYPVIVPARGSSVAGCLIRGLDRRAALRLDAFEGPDYDRVRCTVMLAHGRPIEAWTYVAGRRAAPTMVPWDLSAWRARHKRDFVRRLRAGAGA